MRLPEEKQIGENLYSVTQFPPTEALKYQLELFKLLGKPLGGLFGEIDLKEINLDKEITFANMKIDIANGAAMLADSINPEKHVGFIKSMLRLVRVNDNNLNFDRHFQGKIMEIFEVLLFVIQVNFPDFFSRIGGRLDALSTNESKESSSPEGLTAVS